MKTRTVIMLLLDVVDYSKLSESEQTEIFKTLQRELYYFLWDDIHKDISLGVEHQTMVIPTGDGFFVGVAEEKITPVLLLKMIALMQHLLSRCSGIHFRFAIHRGPITVIPDINRKNNLVGDVINDLSRIISHAHQDGFVISQAIYDAFLRSAKIGLDEQNFLDEMCYRLFSPCVVRDKHGKGHIIHNMLLIDKEKGTPILGVDKDIPQRHRSHLYGPEYPKILNLEKEVKDRLSKAKEIIFYGIYFPNIEKILPSLRKDVPTRISFYFASDELQPEIYDFFGRDASLEVTGKHKALALLKKAKAEYPKASFNIYEYSDIPYFGASAINIGASGTGFIHFSSYIPGILPKETPYVELFWDTEEASPLYAFYRKVLMEACTKAKPVNF